MAVMVIMVFVVVTEVIMVVMFVLVKIFFAASPCLEKKKCYSCTIGLFY